MRNIGDIVRALVTKNHIIHQQEIQEVKILGVDEDERGAAMYRAKNKKGCPVWFKENDIIQK